MTIRGAPAIGVAGAFGMVFAVREKKPSTKEELIQTFKEAKAYLDSSRPTAVNLMWATQRILKEAEEFQTEDFEKETIALAQKIADEVGGLLGAFMCRMLPSTSEWPSMELIWFHRTQMLFTIAIQEL